MVHDYGNRCESVDRRQQLFGSVWLCAETVLENGVQSLLQRQAEKDFDEVIEDKLKSMSHKTERWQYYNLLVGNEDGNTLYGNHQTIYNMLPGDSIRDYSSKESSDMK